MPSPLRAQLAERLTGVYDQQTQLANRTSASMKAGMTEVDALRGLPRPPVPNLMDIPAPPRPLPANDLANEMPFYTLMAVLGGMATRQPLLNATKAMGAAIKGYHEGDMQGFEQHLKSWDADSKFAIQKNQQLMAQRKAIMEDRSTSIQEKLDQIEMLMKAHGLEDKGLSSQGKNLESMLKTLDHHEEQAQRLADSHARMSEMMAYHKTMAELRAEQLKNKPPAAETGWKVLTDPKGGTYRLNDNKGLALKEENGEWKPIKFGEVPKDARPPGYDPMKGNSLNTRFAGRTILAANETARGLEVLGRFPLGTTTPLLQNVTEDGDISGALKANFAREVSQDQAVNMQAALSGMALELTTLMRNGMQMNETEIKNIEQGLKIMPGMSVGQAVFRIANSVSKLHAGLESVDVYTPTQQATKERILKSLSKYPTPEKVMDTLYATNEQTYAQELARIQAEDAAEAANLGAGPADHSGVAPPEAPPAYDADKERRYQEWKAKQGQP